MYNREEKTIYLVDFCLYILRKWKLMVLGSVVLAMVVAGATYLKSSKESQMENQASMQEAVKVIELPADEKASLQAKIDMIEEHKENIEEYDYYLKNALKMKLDPNFFYEGVMDCLISAENNSDVIKALELCYDQAFSEENYEALAECLTEKTDATLLREVVFGDKEYYATELESGSEFGLLFTVRVQHYAKNDCEKMLAYCEKELQDVKEFFENENANVKFEVITSTLRTRSDRSLVTLSKDINTAKLNAYDAISNIEKNMTDAQKEYYVLSQNLKEETTESSEEVVADAPDPSVDLKLVIIAAIIGAMLVAGVYGVLYLFDGRVHGKEELESWVNVPVLNAEENAEMLAALLVGIAVDREVKNVYLADSIAGGSEKIQKLKELLKQENIEVKIGNGILQDAKALQEATEYGCLVLVEKCNVSKEKDIKEELNKAASCGITTLGIVLEK